MTLCDILRAAKGLTPMFVCEVFSGGHKERFHHAMEHCHLNPGFMKSSTFLVCLQNLFVLTMKLCDHHQTMLAG